MCAAAAVSRDQPAEKVEKSATELVGQLRLQCGFCLSPKLHAVRHQLRIAMYNVMGLSSPVTEAWSRASSSVSLHMYGATSSGSSISGDGCSRQRKWIGRHTDIHVQSRGSDE